MPKPLTRKRFIIAADDFGLSPRANKNILKLAEQGKIDRVSVMVHGKFSVKEQEALLKSGVRLDLHLTLPTLHHNGARKKRRVLHRVFIFMKHYLSGKLNAAALEIEWERQISLFRDYFKHLPDGINSHEHIHYFPAYFRSVLKLASRNNIPYIRFGKKGFAKARSNVRRILNYLWKKDEKYFFQQQLESSDLIVSLDWLQNPATQLAEIKTGSIEIVCHPEREKERNLITKLF